MGEVGYSFIEDRLHFNYPFLGNHFTNLQKLSLVIQCYFCCPAFKAPAWDDSGRKISDGLLILIYKQGFFYVTRCVFAQKTFKK